MQHHAQDASLFSTYVENLLGLAASSSGGHASGQVHTARVFSSLSVSPSGQPGTISIIMRANGAIIQRRRFRRRTASAI